MKILVIETAPAICERLLTLLADSGKYEGLSCVTGVTGAIAALELIEDCQPDALLLDVRLADSSGFQVLEALRAAHRNIPTILLSDCVGWQYQIRAQSLAAVALLSKTEQFDEILPTLDRLFSTRPANAAAQP